MAKRRKTKAEQRMEWDEAERRVWDAFLPRLQAAQGIADAIILWSQAVPESRPGRKYYSNLGFFLHTFSPPDGASGYELSLYAQIIERDQKLSPEKKQLLLNMMRSASQSRQSY
jgi:hypothetical protein